MFQIGYIMRLCRTHATREETIVQPTENDSEATEVYGEVDIGESKEKPQMGNIDGIGGKAWLLVTRTDGFPWTFWVFELVGHFLLRSMTREGCCLTNFGDQATTLFFLKWVGDECVSENPCI
jgi:hypothetical protein